MKKRFSYKVFTAIFICAILALSVGLPIYGEVLGGAGNSFNTPTADAAITPAASYSTFADGFTYEYTDKDKIEAFHAGTASSDTTEVTVDTSVTQGSSPQNPFVISTREEWQLFVNRMASDGTKGAGKYFALGADLDWLGRDDFSPVEGFTGTFFGLGHYFKNITKDWNYATYSGIFGILNDGSVVTDLNNDNFYFKRVGPNNGGIVGYSGSTKILNCHASGKFERASISGTLADVGGIMGVNVKSPVIYRSSAKFETAVKISSAQKESCAIGGILGKSRLGGTSFVILDCYADVKAILNNSIYPTGGSCVGMPWSVSSMRVEGFAGKIDYISDNTHGIDREAGLFSGYTVSAGGANFVVKDAYFHGTYTNTKNGTTTVMHSPPMLNMSNASALNTSNCSNINYYANPANPWSPDTSKYNEPLGYPLNSVATNHASLEEVWNLAQTDGKLSDSWSRKDKIGKDLSIKFSPVRNASIRKSTIKFANLKVDASGKETDESVGIVDNTYKGGTSVNLVAPTAKPNHIFEGWTADKSGNGDVFTDLPDELYEEDVTLYAVWGVPDGTVTPILGAASSVSGSDLTATDGTVSKAGSAVATYNSGGNLILTADLQVKTNIMSDAQAVFVWKKNGVVIGGANSERYNKVKNVADSGTYEYTFTYHSQSEPLWRGSGSGASMAVTVKAAPLAVKGFNIADDEHPFVGMRYMNLTPNPIMVDAAGKTITGKAQWSGTHGADKITDLGDGYAEQMFEFIPDDPNYQSGSAYEYKARFKVEYLTITFEITGILNKNLTHRLEYGQPYTYNKVADMFDVAFGGDSGVSMPEGFVPCFTVNGGKYQIDEYRKLKNPDNTVDAYTNVTENITLKVELVEGTYTVTFDPDNGDPIIKQTGVTYGQRAQTVADPTNGSQMFLGWYYDVLNDDGSVKESLRWDFDVNVVTGNITLTAKWLEPSDLVSITVKPKSNAKFIALEELKLSQLTVTANYLGLMPEGGTKPIVADVTFDAANISFTYKNSPNKLLHVNKNGDGTTTITVTYTATLRDGSRKSADFDLIITVDPIVIDTSGWTFNDKTVTYDGTAKSLHGVGVLDPAIIEVKYSYVRGSSEVDEADVINIGIYMVTASFTTDPDYKAEDRTAKLTIAAQAIEVSVTWDKTSFVYNGLQQYPKPAFTDGEGNELPLEYDLDGIENAIAAGNYKVTVILTTGGYAIKDGEDSTAFNITKAVLPVPTLKEGDIIYAGANIDLTDPSNLRLDGFDPNIMEIVSGGTGFNAGNYTVIIKFKSSAAANCSWQSGSSTVSVKWEIKKATAISDWGNNYKFLWDGSAKRPSLVGIIDVFEIDKNAIDLSVLIYEGDVNASEIGSYTVSVRVPASAEWVKNYNLENTSFDFVIVPDENVEIIDVIWENLVFTYNGDLQAPVYKVVDMDGNEVSADVLESILFEIPASKYAGDYTAKATVKAGANYFIRSGGAQAYKINLNAQGEGADPNGGSGNNEPGGNAFIDFFKKLIENNFPLWQVATSGVALLLTLIFMIKAIQYGNRKKKAKGEAKKYNAKTYAALLPIFSTQTVWLNLSNMIWSIIAFSLCGVMLLMFLTMLITRKGWKKAELAKETAIEESEQRRLNSQNANQLALQERIAQIGQGVQTVDNSSILEAMRLEMEQRRREDEERRRADEERHREEMAALREEQAKRDEAMKIMLANMMGRNQADGNMGYAAMDDTDLLVQKVIAGLLPAVQQMIPEAPAYLAAPSEQNDELISLVEQQNEEMRNMAAQISELQEQLSQDRVEGILLPDNSEEIRNLKEKHSAEMQAMSAQMMSMQQKIEMMSSVAVDELDDDDLDDDEEEWDSILDEDDDDFVEAVIIEEDGTVKKTYPNFRMRLKQSSDKNREWYAAVKNLFCSQKGVTYRVYKRVEKIRYQGQVIAVIGIAKRSIKLWLALKPYEYDARRYHHKDVSDKPRFVDVPMYVRVSSDRALTRAQELILALFQELNMEARKRYNDRSIQELIFTLKHNKLLTNKQNKGLLCEVMHVHDCDVLSDELAEKCIESKNVESIDESYIETLKLDDIDAKFQDGNRVTLEKLKKVGLVSEDCTGYTVTAGHRLTKPLIIVANDFTLPAVKMITLTGGRAIKLNQVKQ